MHALFTIQRSHIGVQKFKAKAGLSTSKLNGESESNFHRLPNYVQPLHYTLCIKPNLGLASYEGCVSIQVEIKKEAKSLQLHAVDMNISKIMWEEDETANRQEPFEYFIDGIREQLRIVFEPPLLPGRGCIRINFNSLMYKKTIGFFQSKYKSSKGEDLISGATKFEHTEARRCFPCWDEPAWRSTFDLSFITPKNMKVISNTPVKVTYPHRSKNELHVVEFGRTPLMPTYLVGFVIGEFDFLEARYESRVTIRIYTLIGKSSRGQFALATCVKMLKFFENHFNISYPLPTLDLVAITDLNSTSVGHWGLIILRESRFLTNDNELTGVVRQNIARQIAHEVARQWFGDMVSVDWWSHMWVYDAYVAFMEFVSVHNFFPEFDIWTQFISDVYNQALQLDSFKCAHPIAKSIHNPSEMRDVFDLVSNCKSTALIRMLNQYVGEDVLKLGINQYITKYTNGNAGADQLWKILDDISDKPVSYFMHSWTRQIGYPLLRVTSCKFDPTLKTITITITQEKFWAEAAMRENKTVNKEFLWMVPLTLSAGSSPTKSVKEALMDRRSITLVLQNMQKPQWIKVNPGIYNFFRVKYPTDMLGQFMSSIRSRTMPSIDRLGIISDLMTMVECGLSSAVEIFSLLEAFVDEENYMVWTQIDRVLESLDLLLCETDYYERLKIFCRTILSNIYERLGWTPLQREKSSVGKLRILVLNRMIRLGHEKAIEEGQIRFDAMMHGTKSNAQELRSVLYKVGLKIGSGETQRNFFKMYRATDSLEERASIAQAMGEVQEHDHLQDALQFAISDDVKMHDSLAIFQAVGMRKPGVEVAWEFLKDHWSFLRTKYPAGSFSSELIHHVTSHFTTEDKAVEIQDFFKDHPFAGTERAIHQSLEKIRMMDAWMKKDISTITDYLGSY